jgi:hypothetical protein
MSTNVVAWAAQNGSKAATVAAKSAVRLLGFEPKLLKKSSLTLP